MAIGFFEKIIVISSERFPEYAGRYGVVLGISQDETKIYSYSVFFQGEAEGVGFLPSEIQGTGEYAERSQFYDDADHVRVLVKDGKGFLA